MKRTIGVTSRGIRLPIVKEGDDLVEMVTDGVLKAAQEEGFDFHDKDVIAITESVVARSQGNYAHINDIAKDVIKHYGANAHIGVIFPILSRNRFSILLKGIARGADKITLMLSYPCDEVGNALLTYEQLDKHIDINPYRDIITLDNYRKMFGEKKHEFTGVDYVAYYKKLIEDEGCQCNIIFANDPYAILDFTLDVLTCDIHTRARTKRILTNCGARVFGLDDILTDSVNGSGYNSKYGLLGSNKATEETVKLFPEHGRELVNAIQTQMYNKTGKKVEVMVYGDGAFKDPQGKIWELADPVVSPFYTEGLTGTPNELKLKFLADNDYSNLSGQELQDAIVNRIKEKDNSSLVGKMVSEGTTPRKITDLLGSLCDLTSGSGDKGTPVVLIQGYFDNYTTE